MSLSAIICSWSGIRKNKLLCNCKRHVKLRIISEAIEFAEISEWKITKCVSEEQFYKHDKAKIAWLKILIFKTRIPSRQVYPLYLGQEITYSY